MNGPAHAARVAKQGSVVNALPPLIPTMANWPGPGREVPHCGKDTSLPYVPGTNGLMVWPGAMPTMGALSFRPPVDPRNVASPKAKMPPSDATSQYPPPSADAAMLTMGRLSFSAPAEPKNADAP